MFTRQNTCYQIPQSISKIQKIVNGLIWHFVLIGFALVVNCNVVSLNAKQRIPEIPNGVKILDDGTAYVRGEVVEHISGCEVDGACKLILNVNDQKVALVYAEGDFECSNTQAASWVNWGQNVKRGTKVKAYGAYRKLGNVYELTFCNSKDHFILGENDPVPLGSYTEKFFHEVAKGKSEVQQNQFEKAQKSGKLVNYKNEALGYEFSYPATWSMPQTSPDMPFVIQYHDFSNQNNNWYTITLGFISEAQLANMGIDYCGAHPNDKRCEIRKKGNIVAYVDWGDNYNKSAFTKIASPKGGIITFSLEPNSSVAKSLFIPILNTFKFIK